MSAAKTKQDMLVNAIMTMKKLDKVVELLDSGAKANSPDSYGRLPLTVSVEYRKPNMVELLLKRGADPNKNNSQALWYAIHVDHNDILQMLINAGVNVNVVDNKGIPIIDRVESVSKIGLMIKNGVNPNTMVGNTPYVFSLIAKHQYANVMLLLEKGLDANIKDKETGSTALMIAAKYNLDDLVETFLKAGTDVNAVNAAGETALDIAMGKDNVKTVEKLVKAGAKVTPDTLYHFLKVGQKPKYFEMIIDRVDKSILNSVDKKGKPLFFDVVVCAARLKAKSIIEKFLDAGGDVNIEDSEGRNILFAPASFENLDILSVLIKRGIRINKIDNEGRNILIYMIYKGAPIENIKFIIQSGIDIAAKDIREIDPFLYSVLGGHFDIMKALLELGADIQSIDNEQKNALHYLTFSTGIKDEYTRIDIAKFLVSKGININQKSNMNATPLYYAIMLARKNPTVMSRLALYLLDLPDIDYLSAKTDLGMPPVEYAAQYALFEILKKILTKDIDMTQKLSNGKSLVENAQAGSYEPQINAYILDIAEEKAPNTSGLWRGYTQSDLVKLDTIFEVEPNAEGRIPGANVSLCPVCHKFVFRGEACKYMFHNCSKASDIYHRKLYNLYKNPDGIIWWCTVCGRICSGHTHYVLSALNLNQRPQLVRPGPGADLFSDDCTGPERGGGILEKLARFSRLREVAKELNGQIGTITNKKALYKQIEETWQAPWNAYVRRTNLKPMLATKMYNIPASNFPNAPAVFNSNKPPKANWNAKNYPDVTRTAAEAAGFMPPEIITGKNHGGSQMDDIPVIQFHHVREDGSVNNHEGRYISQEYLDMWLGSKNAGYQSADFGYCWDYRGGVGCSARLFPDEVRPFVDDDTWAEYRRKFNWKFAEQAGGVLGKDIFTEAEDAMCLLPTQVGRTVGGAARKRRVKVTRKRKISNKARKTRRR